MTGAKTVVGGRYELGELLGRGGMAEVRKGTDVRLGRVVAVKRLRTDLASDPTFQARFRREAQSSASLNHHSIVSVYDTGEEPSVDGSGVPQPYIVMDYVAGRTLRDILREGRKILPERALEITSGVLAALDYSHRAGIVHRDIKPANVMVNGNGEVKVMDFGIARAVADTSATMTQTAAVIGTAQYLSPEQARGETVDSRSDVYSTGCLLYELLTGRPPFVGESPVSVAYQHVREQAPPPSSIDPELPDEVDAIVMAALAKDVDARYQSAAQMRADIERFLAGKPVAARAVPPAPPAGAPLPDAVTTFLGSSDRREDEPDRRKRWPLILTSLVVVALLGLAAVLGPLLVSSPPEDKTVPRVLDLTFAEAQSRIVAAGLSVGDVREEASQEVPRGRVMAQDPDALSGLPAEGEVDLTVSTGKPDVVVPFVIGDDKERARREVLRAGLKVRLVKERSDAEPDTVIRADPNPATSVTTGTTVTLYFSAGPTEVPDVVGLGQRVARERLTAAGFEVDVFLDAQTEAERGTVLDQSPDAGTPSPQGTFVTITVSNYVEPTPTPTPTPTETASPTEEASPSVGATAATRSPSEDPDD